MEPGQVLGRQAGTRSKGRGWTVCKLSPLHKMAEGMVFVLRQNWAPIFALAEVTQQLYTLPTFAKRVQKHLLPVTVRRITRNGDHKHLALCLTHRRCSLCRNIYSSPFLKAYHEPATLVKSSFICVVPSTTLGGRSCYHFHLMHKKMRHREVT